MILSSSEIQKAHKRGHIKIDPFDPARINPNSYNVRLHDTLYVLQKGELDMRKKCVYEEVKITDEGFLLEPGRLYLGRTFEYTESHKYVPLIEGRSSIGRLGIFIHATAGFGDVGFCGYWTLEISVIQPVRIYPMIEIAQVYYNEVKGKAIPYKGKYQNNREIQISGLYSELDKSCKP